MSASAALTLESNACLASPNRWLVVVRRDQPSLYAYLRQGFEGIGPVEVILDRRQGEKWPGPETTETEGSRADRRRPGTMKERVRWRSFGYRVAPSNGDLPRASS